jgi:TolB protein
LGGGPRLAFTSDRGGEGYEIFSMTSDGTDVVQLTDSQSNNVFPEYSQDGRFILFWAFDLSTSPMVAEYRIMASDGSGQADFGPGTAWATWSPDGEWIALTAAPDSAGSDILRVPTAGGEATQLTTDRADDREPDWSPDGATIAFTSYRDETPHIYLMDPDGANQRRLTSMELPQFEPDWSPDGSRIAFVSGDNQSTNIYLINTDGTGLQQLTDSPGFNEGPVWSPDGTLIAFWSDRSGNREIYTIRADGTGLLQLTDDPAQDENPAWAPG